MEKRILFKRIIIVVAAVVSILILLRVLNVIWWNSQPYKNHNSNTKSWPFVETVAADRLHYPPEWQIQEGENGLAFLDESGEVILFQYTKNYVWNNCYNEYVDDLVLVEHTVEKVYQSGGMLLLHTLTQCEAEITKRGVVFPSADDDLYFIVWDDALSQELLDEFIESYQINFYASENPAALS